MASEWEVLELRDETEKDSAVYATNQHNIQRINSKQLNYNDFFWQFMKRNWPVILTEVSNNWECRKQWLDITTTTTTIPNENNNKKYNIVTAINFSYLRRRIGNVPVPVANCKKEYFNSHAKSQMDFYAFLDYWAERLQKSRTVKDDEENLNVVENIKDDVLYLKDWHLRAALPDYDFYKVPKHFASDWLNEHLIATQRDDYRFVYMGPKDSWTPFHADVFGSYSWSTNIMGCKKWLLLPPNEELKIRDKFNNLPLHINEEMLQQHKVQYFPVYQMENEALFVPSGWYHQVWNITDTISVNHNWFNACNLARIWCNLRTAMQQVIHEIQDCRQMDDFDDHCQTMLRATFGLNYLEFIQLLETIVTHRLHYHNNGNHLKPLTIPTAIGTSSTLVHFDHYIPNEYHVFHDLKAVQQVLQLMLKDSVICDSLAALYNKCTYLLQIISSV